LPLKNKKKFIVCRRFLFKAALLSTVVERLFRHVGTPLESADCGIVNLITTRESMHLREDERMGRREQTERLDSPRGLRQRGPLARGFRPRPGPGPGPGPGTGPRPEAFRCVRGERGHLTLPCSPPCCCCLWARTAATAVSRQSLITPALNSTRILSPLLRPFSMITRIALKISRFQQSHRNNGFYSTKKGARQSFKSSLEE